ncbi:hypothetical protein L1987_21464 [Smallanthus sonchifolius]|uniref:Uncharacterized protein n=1 Tax=Smallanthus sonchifolius TaxID=185202 RepID=A0ACB9IW45_9ASTR|nr:hypothetical protein L1987_21464 [Smallanthus sonchifolius]
MMRVALTYEEWAHAAKMLDKESPILNEHDVMMRSLRQVLKLIKRDEVSTQLRMVCDSDSDTDTDIDTDKLLLEEKLAFMHETRHAFGRTALLLSGGVSLGAFHVCVGKTYDMTTCILGITLAHLVEMEV